MAAAASLSTFSSLSLHRSTRRPSLLSPLPTTTTSLSPSSSSFFPLSLSTTTITTTKINCTYEDDEIDPVSVFYDSDDPEGKLTSYDPPDMDEEISTRYLEEVALNPLTATEAEIEAAYEKLYGPAYSGVTYFNNNVYDMDSKRKEVGNFGKVVRERFRDEFEEQVVQIRRVTKVVKGGKQLNFRAIVVVGNRNGKVGVGVGKATEVLSAVQKAAYDGRRNIINVPLTKHMTFPHRANGKYGAAEVMLRPACPGTGVIAGGAVRTVLDLAGLENALGKQLRSNNALNNARATCLAIMSMKTFKEVSEFRGIPMEELWK